MKRFLYLLTLLLLLAACQGEATYFGTEWPSPQEAADFTLTSAAGPVTLSDFQDKVVLLYFGYTFCPDVCPGTLADLSMSVTLTLRLSGYPAAKRKSRLWQKRMGCFTNGTKERPLPAIWLTTRPGSMSSTAGEPTGCRSLLVWIAVR